MLKRFFEAANKFIEGSRFSGLIIALVVFVAVLLFSFSTAYDVFELKLYDLRFELKPSIEQWDYLTFVDIDENSLTTVGQFPWPRDKYAEGLQVLKMLGVEQSAFDIMFPDESPTQINYPVLESLMGKAEKRAAIGPEEISMIPRDMDRIFSEGIAEMGEAVFCYTFSSEPLSDVAMKKQQDPAFIEAIERFNMKASVAVPEEKLKGLEDIDDRETISISYPIPEIMNAAHSFGFVNRYTDVDGVIRKVRLVRLFQGRLYFNLAMAMLFDICRVKMSDVEVYPGRGIILKKAFNPVTQEYGDITVPIDRKGMMYVNWAGPGPREKSFHLLPFYSLLDYAYFAGSVHDFFDRMEAGGGKFERSRLYRELDAAMAGYEKSETAGDRIANLKLVMDIRKKISDIKKGYVKDFSSEITRIKEELKTKDDPRLREELEIMQDDVKAMNLVIRLEDELPGHITLTGLTATGTHDIGVVPLHKEYARVGTYHNTVNTILNNGFIRKSGMWLNYLLWLIMSVCMGFLIQGLDARKSIVAIVVSFVVVNIFVMLLFSLLNLWVDQLGLNLALILPSAGIASIKFMNEESQKRFIKNAFSHYLAPGVIDQILEDPEALELGGENREITIFFSDVAGFSTISEKLTPPELVNLLNEYLSEMTDIILAHGGTVDKYEGDAIMAFYGAPKSFPDHELRACRAAIAMKKKLREMQEEWRKIGKDELYVRMGMNTGYAVVGNMGSKTRMDYTAMGDSVNLASRLEGANKFYNTYAMISGATYEGVKEEIEARKLDVIRVVGKTEPVLIYELLGEKGRLPERMYEMLEHYNRGLEFFTNHEWKRAKSSFKEGLKIIDDDGPSLTYLGRCDGFMKKAPSKNWDGVYTLKSK